jgi:hypothetical protein
MPDTGAPWNIPYVEAADLVSDWPADSLALANAIDAGLDAAGPAGIGSNVVQTVKTDTFSTTSTSMTDITGLTVTITPTSASSKVLLIAKVQMGHSGGASAVIQFARGGTGIGATPAAWGLVASEFQMENLVLVYLDSPASTSALTYSVQTQNGYDQSGTAWVNRRGYTASPTLSSSITAIEVAA